MLIVHRATSAAALAAGLAAVLSKPPADPFATEVVAVPAKGVERWIAQRLSHVLGATSGDGVCANVDFPWASTLLDHALQTASPAHAEAVERWAPEQCRWPLLEVIDTCAASEAWCQPLAQHLGVGAEDKGRRVAVASRLARLFDSYAQARPQMLRLWADRADERGDGTPLDDDLRWQAELWRRLRDRLATPSPAELLEDACSRLRGDPTLSMLPERVSIFGASRLSPARLAVFAALAEHRDCHLWLHHASPALWETVAREQRGALRRKQDSTRAALHNRLLASLSRDILELQQLLGRCASGFNDVLHEGAAPPDTLLGRLKRDLAEDTVRAAPPLLHPDDTTVQVHACHGRTRQVEVLREVIVGLLASDPTLQPRDVLVMCPDVETYAPLIAATFSLGAEEDAAHPAARLRVRLADRALRQTNALLGVLSQLLELGTARLTASQVLDLMGTAAVRQRFGFDDDEIERLRSWTASAGIRWGLDRGHRRTWALTEIGQGTWREGLDRLLVGVTMEGVVGSFGQVVPLDDVDSADIDLAGRFAELVDRLATAQELMAGWHTAQEWAVGLEAAVLSLAGSERHAEWQDLQLHSELADIAEAASGSSVLLSLADVRSLLSDTLAGRPTRASFRTGTLTVCTLVPMRSVPHRVVCLLGIDDGVFPRQSTRDGDDVLARDPWVGERDPRSEDRQLLLDAISAAGEHLVITYTGADERTNAPVPPAVPLGELLDALDRTARTSTGGTRVRDVITTHHPLQPFDARNFTPGKLGSAGPFSFDPLGYAGALAAAAPRSQPQPFLAGPLPAKPPADIDLADLARLLEHPARGFLRQRLQVAVTREEEEPADALPVKLDSLELWAIGERVLRDRVAGLEPAECSALELRRGALPPGPLGWASLQEVGRNVEAIVQACAAERAHEPESYDIDIDLGDMGPPNGTRLTGTRLTGTVAGVRGDSIVYLTYSQLGARQRLHAWVELVALTVAHPGRAWCAVTVGRGRKPATALRSCLGPLTADEAELSIVEMVALYRAGLRAPLPLPVKTAGQYAFLRGKGTGVLAARVGAADKWTSGTYPGEQADTEHGLVYGPNAPMSVLTDQPPGEGESGAGWPPDETDRFGLLARRLWGRLLAAETEQP